MYTYQSPIKLFAHNHYILSALLMFLILGGVGAWFLVWPYYQTMVTDRESILTAQEKTIKEQDTYLSELRQITTKYASLDESMINELNIALPATPAVPEIIVALDALTKKVSGSLMLESVAVGEGRPSGDEELKALGLGTVKVSLTFAGSLDYASWKNLVAALNTNLRIFGINSISFSPAESKHRVNITAYYLIP